MNIIIATLIIILLYSIFTTWLDNIGWKHKEELMEKAIDKASSLIDSKMESVTDQCDTGPWYLVVYTQDSNYPIWISNNTILSLHPDPKAYRIIIKQFNGDDMVIDKVESYKMVAADDLFDYDF